MNCDATTGSCLLPDVPASASKSTTPVGDKVIVRYIGDPMCSWCWGISPELERVSRYCNQKMIGFTITMGGLRAGGGDAWVSAFKDFLRREWTHIAKVTGQPFGLSLLNAEQFDYDTEPACRAVVLADEMLAQQGHLSSATLSFFAAVQRKFYVDGADPKEVSFYRSICTEASISFDEFEARFSTAAARQAVQQQFSQCKKWGVRSFPTLLLELDGEIKPLSSGAITATAVIEQIERALAPAQD